MKKRGGGGDLFLVANHLDICLWFNVNLSYHLVDNLNDKGFQENRNSCPN